MIAGLAVGAKIGFIYLRGEYRYLLNIMEKAVADAYARGFLGKNIFGVAGVDFDIVTQTGAGAYEVGEESALMESLEGKRGVPRIRPPFPAVVGLYGGPTDHQQRGDHRQRAAHPADGRRGLRQAGHRAQRRHAAVWHFSGHVERPGVYELPMGYSLRKAIYEVAGGIKSGKQLKAVVPGGASCPVLRADEIDVGLDFDQTGQGRHRCSGRAASSCSTRPSPSSSSRCAPSSSTSTRAAAGASPAARAPTGSRRR